MVKRDFIRLNVNDNYLSLGNLFRIIKEESYNSNNFLQSELFSIIFDTEDVADSTVNNYCTGLRAINSKFKNYFRTIKNKYDNDKNILIITVGKIIELIEEKNINLNKISVDIINNNTRLKRICTRLYSISKNDSDVNTNLSNRLHKSLNQDNLYYFISQVLFYVILEKKQPIYISENINNMIEKNIYDTNMSINDIQEFIDIQLNSGMWSIRGIKELAKKNNPFACFEIASMECYGIITGKARYEEAYKYYKIASEYNHPVANWAIGYLYYEGHIGTRSKHDLYVAFKYFNKARKLKCSNAFNSIGLMILNENIPLFKKDEQKAIKMFEQSISMGNIYAYNNLGKIYENKSEYKKAFDLYIVSANAGESWASNKIGEMYRKGILGDKNLRKAYEYYCISSEAPIYTLCAWSKYNLAKYFYMNGNVEVYIKKDLNKAIMLLEEVADELIEASEELIYIYYKLYKDSNNQEKKYYDKIMFFKQKCEFNTNYNERLKKRIEKTLLKIKKNTASIIVPD